MKQSTFMAATVVLLGGILVLLIVIVLRPISSDYQETHRRSESEMVFNAKAIADVMSLADAIETYKIDTGMLPSEILGLRALENSAGSNSNWNGPYIKGAIPRDAWGNDYLYRFPGKRGPFDVFSLGSDGLLDTVDDIGNWKPEQEVKRSP